MWVRKGTNASGFSRGRGRSCPRRKENKALTTDKRRGVENREERGDREGERERR